MNMIRKCAALLLSISVLWSVAACAGQVAEPTQTPTETTAVPTVPRQTVTEPATEPVDYANLVTDAYVTTYGQYCYHIPQVNLPDNRAEKFNYRVYTYLHGEIMNHVFTEYVEYNGPDLISMQYSWGVKGDLLSIIVEAQTGMNDLTNYYTYTISLKTGREVSAPELYAAFGLDEAGFYSTVENTMNRYWNNMSFSVSDAFVQSCIDRTLAYENVHKTVGYINEKGELSLVANIYSFAGADSYYRMLNTVGEVNADHLECKVH